MSSSVYNIPVDDDYATYGSEDDDTDLSYSSAATLATTITRYRYENGRRYHAFRDGEYHQPNDERQIRYEMLWNHLWLRSLDDRLFLAPVDNPQRVLDIGTGSGLWAIDFADQFPSAEVIGTDLSPVQNTSCPPNVRFEIDDCCSEWTYPENSFNYVHMRGMCGSVADWPELYRQCFRHMEPGGYLEQAEYSVFTSASPTSEDPNEKMMADFSARFIEAGVKIGKDFEVAERMAQRFKDAGFIDIVEKKFAWPIGAWSSDIKLKEIGAWNVRHWDEGLEGWIIALYTRVLGWTYEEVQAFIIKLRSIIRDRKYRFLHEVVVVYGRKPMNDL